MAKSGPRTNRSTPASDDVRAALIAATIAVTGEVGFAQTSARAVAKRAGVAPGVIYYHFASMDGLLSATHDALTSARVERIRSAMAGATASNWVAKLTTAITGELDHPDGGAAIELTIGAKSSPELAASARRNTDLAVAAVAEMAADVLGDSIVGQLVPIEAIAEVAAAAFFGAEVMAQIGRRIDVELITAPLAALLSSFDSSPTAPPA